MSETYDVTTNVNLPLIGAPRPRYESRAKVTGSAAYAADAGLPGALFAQLVTTTHARGTLDGMDLEAARAVPGVRLILDRSTMPQTGALTPYTQGGTAQNALPPLPGPEIHFAGQPVALVVAETPEAAREAAKRVRLSVTPAPAVASMHADDAPAPEEVPADMHPPVDVGDVEAAFAQADATADGVWRTPIQHHNPIELWFAAAEWRNGQLTAHIPSQWVTGMRSGLATAFGLPVSQVRVVSQYVGGGFGSKATIANYILMACAAARAVDAPVKLYVDRDEMFTVASFRPATTQRLRVAVKDGRLSALDHTQEGQTSRIDRLFLPGTEQTARMYDWSAIRAREATVATDTNTPGFMRAPAEVPALFALESAVDEAAWAAGLDPVQLRLDSDAAQAEPVEGKPWTSHGLAECYRRGAEAFGWSDWRAETGAMRRGDWLHGFGTASSIYPAYTRPGTAELVLGSDLSARVTAAAHELGGGTYTLVQQIVAAELGLDPERIRVDMGDSDLPPNGVAGGSTQTASMGSAVLDACRRARARLIEAATASGGPLEGADPAAIAFEGARMVAGDRSADLEAVFESIPYGVVEVTGAWTPQPGDGPTMREFYRRGSAKQVGFVTEDFARGSFGAQFVEVAVHALTGEVRVPRMVGAFAFGRVLNERTARSQLTGGMIWGVGSVLHEATEVDHRHGRYVNSDLGEYFVPVNADVPSVEAIIVEEEDRHVNPLGAKGVGELGIVGVNAAVANAVYHATGIRLREAPIRMEHLLGA